MKILEISGKNLASLEDEFLIDFTAEPLLSAGMFAISGSTGSGKSTILDAICLALYDKTPRTNQASENLFIKDVSNQKINQGDSRSVLRRGSAEGFASVVFVALNGDKFRSKWSVRRAHNRVDGTLQSSVIELTNLSKLSQEQGTKRELLEQIEALTGLSFEQFTRSVMLAQGDFATFLKAKQSQKADLLEKLTGTEIYSRISSHIYYQHRSILTEIKQIEQQISSTPLRSKEEIAGLELEHLALSDRKKLLQEQLNQIKITEQWIEREGELIKDKNSVSESLKEISARLEVIKPQIGSIEEKIKKQNEEYTIIEPQIEETIKLDSLLDHLLKDLQTKKEEVIALEKREKDNREKREENEKERESLIKNKRLQNEWFEKYKGLERAYNSNTQLSREIKNYYTLLRSCKDAQHKIETSSKILTDREQKLEKFLKEKSEIEKTLSLEILRLRGELEKGKPCPVCGSSHHPAIANQHAQEKVSAISARQSENQSLAQLDIIKREKEIDQAIQSLTESLTSAKEEVVKAKESLSIHSLQMSLALTEIESFFEGTHVNWREYLENGTLEERFNKLVLQWSNFEKREAKHKEEAKELELRMEALHKEKNQIEAELKERKEKLSVASNDYHKHKEQRAILLKGKSVREVKEEFQKQKEELISQLEKSKKAFEQFNIERIRQESVLLSVNGELDRLISTVLSATAREMILTKGSVTEEYARLEDRLSEISLILKQEKEFVSRAEMLNKEHKKRSDLLVDWEQLKDLFGSADGGKFKEIAQGYTLEVLLSYANTHLEELTSRYRLQRTDESLGLQVCDNDMLGEVRSVHSLSGGESFLISLALALGLASLSSNRMNIESLFIDEGFGTLDSETLLGAIEALERLQGMGKKIGVISHISDMTERIGTQIEVKKNRKGKSVITVK